MSHAVVANLLQVVVIGLIVSSLFFQVGTSLADARSKLGAAFLLLMFMSMASAQRGLSF